MQINIHITGLLFVLFIQKFNIDAQNVDKKALFKSMNRANPELILSITEIIKLYNFAYEEHTVTTVDGYLIIIQRIISKSSNNSAKYPVVLMHGLSCYSIQWVDNQNASLAFELARHGYDVWLGNIRGKPYGEKTVHKLRSKQYWDFSFQENGVRDVPAIIDFILNKTGFDQLFYIGHSMGTTMMFVLLSEMPEYNAKIKGYIALAPIAYCTHVLSEVFPLNYFNEIYDVLHLFHIYAIEPNPLFRSLFLDLFCNNVNLYLCGYLIKATSGIRESLLNKTRVPLYVSHCSVGVSLKTLAHFGQIRKSRKFAQFNYGTESANKIHYGMVKLIYPKIINLTKVVLYVSHGTAVLTNPPEYDLSKISAPVGLFWGGGDILADTLDIEKLRTKLPNIVIDYKVPFENFTHADFLWAKNVKELLYDKLIQTMNTLI